MGQPLVPTLQSFVRCTGRIRGETCQLDRTPAVKQLFGELSVGRDDIRPELDQQYLESHDHQHGGQD